MAQLCSISLSLISCRCLGQVGWVKSPVCPCEGITVFASCFLVSYCCECCLKSPFSEFTAETYKLIHICECLLTTRVPSRSFFHCVLMQGDVWWLWQAVSVMTAQCGVCHVELTWTFWWGVRRGQAVGTPPVLGIIRLKETVPDLTYRGIFKPWHPARSFHCLSPCRLARWHTNTSLDEQMAWSRALRLSSGEEEKVMVSRGVAVPMCVCVCVLVGTSSQPESKRGRSASLSC